MKCHACTILVLLVAGLLPAAEGGPTVVGPDRVVVEYHGTPVAFRLAHLEVDDGPGGSEACQARLAELLAGQEVQVIYKDGFGIDDGGTGRVHLRVNRQDVNQILVAEGLARFVDSGDRSSYGGLLRLAQTKAEREQTGLWGRPPVLATVEEPAMPEDGPAVAPVVDGQPKGPYCAELSGSQYYAADDVRVAQLNQAQLIYYRSESAAERAGKRPAPVAVSASAGGGLEDAQRLLEAGKELYRQAIGAGNTTRRDDLYGESFAKFTAAMQIYSQLVEAAPDDPSLGEQLRETMQLRYGAMKQRRL